MQEEQETLEADGPDAPKPTVAGTCGRFRSSGKPRSRELQARTQDACMPFDACTVMLLDACVVPLHGMQTATWRPKLALANARASPLKYSGASGALLTTLALATARASP